jgi:hypothetical protein
MELISEEELSVCRSEGSPPRKSAIKRRQRAAEAAGEPQPEFNLKKKGLFQVNSTTGTKKLTAAKSS